MIKQKSIIVSFLEILYHRINKPLAIKYYVYINIVFILGFYYIYVDQNFIYVNVMGFDDVLFLDGIYRVSSGQIPHLDFKSGLGAFNFSIAALINIYFDDIITSFLYFKLFLALLSMMLATYMIRTRLNSLLGIIGLILIGLLVNVPLVDVHLQEMWISDAMYYNRFGWGLVSITALFYLDDIKKHNKHLYIYDTLVLSIILIVSFYMKITYFVVIVALLSYFYLLHKRQTFIYAAIIFVLVLAAIELMYPGIHYAYFLDLYQMLLASKQSNLLGLKTVIDRNFYTILNYILFLIIIFLTVKLNPDEKSKIYLFTTIIGLMALYLALNNAEKEMGATLQIAMIIVYTLCYNRHYKTISIKENGLLLLFIIFSITPTIWWHGKSIVQYYHDTHTFYPFYYKLENSEFDTINRVKMVEGYYDDFKRLSRGEKPYNTLHKIKMNSSHRVAKQSIYQSHYWYSVLDGSRRLKEVMSQYKRGKVITLSFANPFAFILQLEPVQGDTLWYHYMRNYNKKVYWPYTENFANADYIMEAKYSFEIPIEGLDEIYMPFIKKDFVIVDDSPLWKIWMRKKRDF